MLLYSHAPQALRQAAAVIANQQRRTKRNFFYEVIHRGAAQPAEQLVVILYCNHSLRRADAAQDATTMIRGVARTSGEGASKKNLY
jgi:hypothetical protein